MNAETFAATARLLETSLAAWNVAGEVQGRPDSSIALRTNDADLAIRPAPDGLPFRWMVTMAGRERGVTSVLGLLRLVRRVVQPDYEAYPLRIAPLPMVPQ